MEDIERTVITEETVTAPGSEQQKNTGDKKRRRRGNVIAAIVLCLVAVWWVIGAPFFDFGWSHLPSTNTCYEYEYPVLGLIDDRVKENRPNILLDWKKSIILALDKTDSFQLYSYATMPIRIQLNPLNFDWILDGDFWGFGMSAEQVRRENAATWVYLDFSNQYVPMTYVMIQKNGDLLVARGGLLGHSTDNPQIRPMVDVVYFCTEYGNANDFYAYYGLNGK